VVQCWDSAGYFAARDQAGDLRANQARRGGWVVAALDWCT